MRFHWLKKSSRAACITMAVARVKIQGMDIEAALNFTLHKGHATNPEAISKREWRSLNRDVSKALRKIEENRWYGSSASG
ncbi:hypothetical protein [Paenibacillus alvei]|uniref:Uncharacterized protein n=1 Tax=Paenibacillus alvei TaxID=44250 RepID=A0AAP7A5R4_PAEAL|nr:hypothetical protein [Paenibacillus alvei]NOJ73157.1 hypothetical protein [Paenibacillus alvei]